MYDGSLAGALSARNELIELELVLPQWQVSAVERIANGLGMTTGQYLRQIIHQFVSCSSTWHVGLPANAAIPA